MSLVPRSVGISAEDGVNSPTLPLTVGGVPSSLIRRNDMGGFGSFFSYCIVHWVECLMILLGLSYFYYLGTLVVAWILGDVIPWLFGLI
jgi:hypothetical protein